MLFEGGEDLRPLPFDERRAPAGGLVDARTRPARMDLSPQIAFASLDELAAVRDGARAASIEGLMLKRARQPLCAGPAEGAVVEVEARPAHHRRGADVRAARPRQAQQLLFGLHVRPLARGRAGDDELVPVGKAYFGFTDQELAFLDRWIRNHTVARFGPVREVEKALVLEVAFDAAQLSTRHKSGVGPALPSHRPHPHRQARRRGGPAGDADAPDRAPARPRADRELTAGGRPREDRACPGGSIGDGP